MSFHFDASDTCICFFLSIMHLTHAYGLFYLIIDGQFFFIDNYKCTFEFQTYDVTLTLHLQEKEVSLEAKIYGQLQVSAILSKCDSME